MEEEIQKAQASGTGCLAIYYKQSMETWGKLMGLPGVYASPQDLVSDNPRLLLCIDESRLLVN